MALITFISDLGLKDFYVAAVKGAIYHRYPVAQVIDITHEVSEYHLLQCAFLLRSVYKSFPKGLLVSLHQDKYVSGHILCLSE
jgi:S-adenosylmethionine hydrolase